MENCAIKIIKKLSCCITGKSIRSATTTTTAAAAQQQPAQLLQPAASARDHQRPGAQLGSTTLQIKKLLVQPSPPHKRPQIAAATSESKDILDYASAKNTFVIDAFKSIDNAGASGNMVQLPKDRGLRENSDSSTRSGIVVMSGEEEVGHAGAADEQRDCEVTKQADDTNKDINHSDIDRSGLCGDLGEDDEDPYAELDMYLEKVKVSLLRYCVLSLYDGRVRRKEQGLGGILSRRYLSSFNGT